jgi:hypothetical protein
MKLVSALLPIIFFTFIYFSVGCKDTLTGDELDSRVIPDSNVSYSKDIQPVLDLKCSNSGCHDDGSRAGGLSLSSWVNTTADPGIVFPYEPENSRLVWAIEGRIGATPMPPIGYPTLTKNQINGIRIWVEEGAKNN